jgi:hypothetical protein
VHRGVLAHSEFNVDQYDARERVLDRALPECMYSALQHHLEFILLQLRILVPARRGIFRGSGAGAEWTPGWNGAWKGGINLFIWGRKEGGEEDGEGTFRVNQDPEKKL